MSHLDWKCLLLKRSTVHAQIFFIIDISKFSEINAQDVGESSLLTFFLSWKKKNSWKAETLLSWDQERRFGQSVIKIKKKSVIFPKFSFSLTVQIISIISFPLQAMAHFLWAQWRKELSCWQFSFKCEFLQWFEILCGEIEFPISSSWMPLNM